MNVIELNLICEEINRRLGSAYRVMLNSSPEVDTTGQGVDVVMRAQRVPFSISDIDSETLRIDLTFRTLCERPEQKVAVMRDLGNLMGHSTGELSADGKVYDYAMYFEVAQPFGEPEVDKGTLKQNLGMSGNMLVTARDAGAIVSNNIYTHLRKAGASEGAGAFLPALSVTTSSEYGTETFRPLNRKISALEQTSEADTIEIIALMLNREFDDELMRRIQFVENYRDSNGPKQQSNPLNEEFILERIFPNFMFQKRVKLLSGTVIEQAGAYAQYRLAFQEVDDG